jgi:hypothetical protein
MIELHPQIEHGILPEHAAKIQNLSLIERAKLAVHTFHVLNEAADPYPNSTTDVDELFDAPDPLAAIEQKAMNQAVLDLADPKANADTLHKTLTQTYKYSRPAVKRLDRVLAELDEEIVNVAVRLRAYTTNKLIEESENPDPKVRIKALELLGKVKDVGLFSEKIEITHKTKSDEELEAEIRQRLEVYMGKADVVDAEEVEEEVEEELVVKPLDALKAVVDVKTAAESTDTP